MMKKEVILLLLIFTIGLIQPISAYQTNGNYLSLADDSIHEFSEFEGKVLLVDAIATYCEPCKTEFKHLSQIKAVLQDNITILSLSVSPSTDTVNKINLFKAEAEDELNFDITWEFGIDKDLDFLNQYPINILPSLLLFTADGKLDKKWEGVTDPQEVVSYIDANITIPETNPVNDMINQLLNNPLFKLTLILSILIALYKIFVPKKY